MDHAHFSLFERALEIDFFDLRTQIGCRLDQGDKAVFDGQGDRGTVGNVFAEVARGFDGEVRVAAGERKVSLAIVVAWWMLYLWGGLGSRSTFSMSRM